VKPTNQNRSDQCLDIVIVNFNGGHKILDCINSAIALDDINQIIVADNGSNDGSLEELQSIAKQNARVVLVRNAANIGFSAGNNRAIHFLSASYALFINPDTLISGDAVRKLLTFMSSDPQTGMAGPLILNQDGSEQRACRRDEPTPLAALKTLVGNREKGINKVGKPLPAGPVEVDAISGACMLVRREALEDVGPLDEGYFLHCEDLDWCKRFWLKGWKVMFLPHVSITHAKGGSSHNRRVRVEWHKHKGMARYYRKFYTDQYPRILMYGVYAAIWARFFLLTPVWLLQSLRR